MVLDLLRYVTRGGGGGGGGSKLVNLGVTYLLNGPIVSNLIIRSLNSLIFLWSENLVVLCESIFL